MSEVVYSMSVLGCMNAATMQRAVGVLVARPSTLYGVPGPLLLSPTSVGRILWALERYTALCSSS